MPEIKAPELNPGACKGVDIIIISDYAYNDLQQYLNDIAQKQGFNSAVYPIEEKRYMKMRKTKLFLSGFADLKRKMVIVMIKRLQP